MLRIEHALDGGPAPDAPRRRLVLTFADRSKSRLRVVLDDGTEGGLFQPRGSVLRHGALLGDGAGGIVEIVAAHEALYEVRASAASPDPAHDLLRAAYHLGNRHVPVAVHPGRLLLERDPVLREMLAHLGLEVRDTTGPFDPEAGAYGGGHRHDHDAGSGALGELLSREAHGVAPVADLSSLRFVATGHAP